MCVFVLRCVYVCVGLCRSVLILLVFVGVCMCMKDYLDTLVCWSRLGCVWEF